MLPPPPPPYPPVPPSWGPAVYAGLAGPQPPVHQLLGAGQAQVLATHPDNAGFGPAILSEQLRILEAARWRETGPPLGAAAPIGGGPPAAAVPPPLGLTDLHLGSPPGGLLWAGAANTASPPALLRSPLHPYSGYVPAVHSRLSQHLRAGVPLEVALMEPDVTDPPPAHPPTGLPQEESPVMQKLRTMALSDIAALRAAQDAEQTEAAPQPSPGSAAGAFLLSLVKDAGSPPKAAYGAEDADQWAWGGQDTGGEAGDSVEAEGIVEAEPHTDGHQYVWVAGRWLSAPARYYCVHCDVFGNEVEAHVSTAVHQKSKHRGSRPQGPGGGGWAAGAWHSEDDPGAKPGSWPQHGPWPQQQQNWRHGPSSGGREGRRSSRDLGSEHKEAAVSDKFAALGEALYQAERKAREEIKMRKEAALQEKVRGEENQAGELADQGGADSDPSDASHKIQVRRWQGASWNRDKRGSEASSAEGLEAAGGDRHRPASAQPAAGAAAESSPLAPVKPAPPWHVAWSQEHGAYYYWNAATGKVSWEPPRDRRR